MRLKVDVGNSNSELGGGGEGKSEWTARIILQLKIHQNNRWLSSHVKKLKQQFFNFWMLAKMSNVHTSTRICTYISRVN
jgi:hypothetical protein